MSYKTQYRFAVGEYFHVYNRAVQTGRLFDSPGNYTYFIDNVQSSVGKGGVLVVCFCLMPSHYHFLLEQIQPQGISQFVQEVCNSYAKALNRQRRKTGHVFESKYKIKPVSSDNYLTWLSRYIHRNPEEARLVRKSINWRYSSYGDFLGLRRYNFVSPEVVLSQFGSREDYRRFVEGEAGQEPEGLSKCLFDE